ncbi:MAG: hypothetical protein JNL64_06545 [Blastocatellia bacterium]|nr:hypothetical protein [Blastocatellia bacterium]
MLARLSSVHLVLVILGLMGLGAVLVFSTGKSQALNSPVSQSLNKEANNNRQMNELLRFDGLQINESTLLPSPAENVRTLQVRVMSDASSEFSDTNEQITTYSMLDSRAKSGSIARQRTLELMTTELLIASVNDRKEVLWWSIQSDPAVLNAHATTNEGHLIGSRLYKRTSDMLISIPADDAIRQLRIYRPIWDGSRSYRLSLIGEIDVRGAKEVAK